MCVGSGGAVGGLGIAGDVTEHGARMAGLQRLACLHRLAVACLLFALMLAQPMGVQAAPPVLDIVSGPVAATCTRPGPGDAAGKASGATLLKPAPLSSVSGGDSTSAIGGDLYQATMDIGDWSGHFAHYVLPAGAGATSAPSLAWDAGAMLTGRAGQPPMPAPEQRKIYTAIVQSDGALATIPFAWADLSPAQQALLDLKDGLGEKRLAYLRGDRSLEGAVLRRRSSVLGDSVNSTPVYVGPVGRRAAVYLGANDGMLHAFDAISGQEIFAYVPNALIAQLHHLTSPAYGHRAYVDGPASSGEVAIDGNKRTVLISAMGGGAQGVFALDVTDPSRFAEGPGALWEFTDRDDAMMGNVTTWPQVAKVRTSRSGGRSTYRYFAVVASGINNYDKDGHASSAGKGALFLLALDKPPAVGWQLNVNYYRLITPISESSLANALSAPVLLNDSEGALRYAYGGDLQGNLWRFDFSGSPPWSGAVGPGAHSTPLFVARDANGKRQPITQQPLLAYAGERGYMVLFGTGRLIEKADRASATRSPQSYYAIIDSLQSPPDLVTGRRQLTERVLDGGPDAPLLHVRGARMDSGSKGWYLDLLSSQTTGERSIHSGLLSDGQVLFNTLMPGADACSVVRSRSYVLNVLTGLADGSSVAAISPANEAIVGLMLPDYAASPSLLPQSSVRRSDGPAGRIKVEKSAALVNVAANGAVQPVVAGSVKVTKRSGRLSWREVANWRELHEAAK